MIDHELELPTPEEAQALRFLAADNPVIQRAVEALRAFGGVGGETAAVLLPMWVRYTELTTREVNAVLAHFVPEPERWAPAEAMPPGGSQTVRRSWRDRDMHLLNPPPDDESEGAGA